MVDITDVIGHRIVQPGHNLSINKYGSIPASRYLPELLDNVFSIDSTVFMVLSDLSVEFFHRFLRDLVYSAYKIARFHLLL